MKTRKKPLNPAPTGKGVEMSADWMTGTFLLARADALRPVSKLDPARAAPLPGQIELFA